MKTFLLTAMLISSLAVSASAADTFYVMFNKTTKKCSVSTTPPTETEKFSMMGQYGSAGCPENTTTSRVKDFNPLNASLYIPSH